MHDLLHFVRHHLARYVWWYLAGTLALLATNGLSVTIPIYVAQGVDAMVDGDDRSVALRAAMIVAGMGVAVIGVRTLSRVLFFTPGRLVEAEVKRETFAAIIRHKPAFLRQWDSGDLFARVSSDATMVRVLAGFGTLQSVNTVIAITMAGGQMLRLSSDLAVWLLGPIALALVVVQVFIRRLFVLMRRQQEQLADLSSHALASYRGIATVQGFAAQKSVEAMFAAHNHGYRDTQIERAWIGAALGPTLTLATAFNIFLLLWIGGPMVIEGTLSTGELVAFTTLIAYVTGPLRASSFLLSVVKQAQASLERLNILVQTPPNRPELPDPTQPAQRAPTLELRDLTFSYPGADTPSLEGVSVTIPAGTTLGILGLTGAGKTTLLAVLSRLYDPPPGMVFVDGVDVRELDLDTWREVSTLVTQRPFLFSESVADNILLGEDDPDRLELALQLASLGPDLESLPDGTDTLVGESGVRLSGGQRQRTALARGLVREHHLLMLDDVLSAVDHHTEQELLASIRDAGGEDGLTTIIVAHRVSALQHADQVLVLADGQVESVDTPANLVQRPGLYRDTWVQQQQQDAS